MQVRVKFGQTRSFEKFTKQFENFFDSVRDQTIKTARANTPIRSGFARSQWTKQDKSNGFEVKNKTPYIGMLDRGRSKQAKQGLSKPTARKVAGYIKNTRRISR